MDVVRNRSLDRGITLLEALARYGACSLGELHKNTGIAKSTIRRLLATMIDRQIVRRSLSDGKYRTNVSMPSGHIEAPTFEQMLMVDIAMPYLMELTKSVEWPSDLHLLEDDWMRIIDSTRPLSPFHLYRGQIDRKINQFGAAGGIACLSVMKDREIEYRIERLGNHRIWGLARFGMLPEQFWQEIEKTRGRGYGARLHDYLGDTIIDDSLSAIAVPIIWRDRPVGAATMLWPRTYLSAEEFAASFLQHLNETASAIMQELEAHDRKSVQVS